MDMKDEGGWGGGGGRWQGGGWGSTSPLEITKVLCVIPPKKVKVVGEDITLSSFHRSSPIMTGVNDKNTIMRPCLIGSIN